MQRKIPSLTPLGIPSVFIFIVVRILLGSSPSYALTGGAGITVSNGTVITNSNSAGFLGNASSLSCSSSAGKMIIDSTADTLSWCDSAGSTVKEAALGDDSGNPTLGTLLAGRTGTGNDTTLTTSAAGTGTIYGASTTGGNLTLQPNSNNTTTGVITLNAPQVNFYSSFPSAPTTTITLLNSTPTTTLTSGTGNYAFAYAAPVISVADTMASQYFTAGGSVTRTGNSNTLYDVSGFYFNVDFKGSTAAGPLFQDAFWDNAVIEQTANTGTNNTYQPISFLAKPTLRANSGATLTIGQTTGLDAHPGWGAASGTFTNTTYSAIRVHKPCLDPDSSVQYCAGTPTLTNYIGLDVQDLDETGGTSCSGSACAVTPNPMSLRSIGTTTSMRHAGPARFGATGAPTTGYSLDVEGATLLYANLSGVSGGATTAVTDSNPTLTLIGTASNFYGHWVRPTINLGSASSVLDTAASFFSNATMAVNSATSSPSAILYGFYSGNSSTSSVTTVAPQGLWAFYDNNTVQYTTTGTASGGVAEYGFIQNSVVKNTSTGSFTHAEVAGLRSKVTLSAAASGTTILTTRYGVKILDVAKAAAGGTETLTNQYAIDVDDLVNAGTDNVGVRLAVSSGTNKWNIKGTGTADSALTGNLRLGDTTAPTALLDLVGKFTADSNGRITKYNNVAKDSSHNGVPFIVAKLTSTGNNNNIAAADVLASGSVVAGRYRMCAFVDVTTAAGTSSSLPNVNVKWTDQTDSIVKTAILTAANTGNTTGAASTGCGIIDAKVSTAIQYSTTSYASSAANVMQYKLYITLEAL